MATEIAHQDRAHAVYAASSASRWMACPGSIALTADIPEQPSSEYALEGTRAHELAEHCVSEGDLPENVPDTPAEMSAAIRVYLDTLEEILGPRPWGGHLWAVEQKVTLGEGLYGTCDFFALVDGTLHVIDLKYGRGVPVEVENNPQLQYYALGALFHPLVRPRFRQVKEVRLTIVQPRAPHEDGPVRSITFEPLDLVAFFGRVKKAVAASKEPDAPLVPGSHCRFCPAAATCPARANARQLDVHKLFQPYLPPPVPFDASLLDNEAIARIKDRATLIQGWLKDVDDEADKRAQAGQDIPGWKLVDKRPTRRWKEIGEFDLAATLEARGVPHEEIWKRDIVSPAQAEGVLAQALRKDGLKAAQAKADAKERLANLVTATSSGQNLVPEGDVRQRVFSGPGAYFQAQESSNA